MTIANRDFRLKNQKEEQAKLEVIPVEYQKMQGHSTMRDEEFENLNYEKLVQLTLKEAEQIEGIKKKRIKILAKKLEQGKTPREMISQKITRDLQGWVNSKYVRECLGEAYKDTHLVREQTTSQRRGSTPAIEGKNLLVSITNKGKQETTETPKEHKVEETGISPKEDLELIASLKTENKRLRKDLAEKIELLSKNTFEGELVERGLPIALIVQINWSTGRARITRK